MKFSDLNADCLLAIFSHLTINQLLAIESVCKHWQFLAIDLCHRKRQLIIVSHSLNYYTKDEENKFQFLFGQSLSPTNVNQISVHSFADPRTFRLILRKFPRISHLEVYSSQLSGIIKQLVFVLKYTWPNLQSLKVIVQDGDEHQAFDPNVQRGLVWARLVEALVGCTNLKSLTLWAYCECARYDIRLPALAQLEELSTNFVHPDDDEDNEEGEQNQQQGSLPLVRKFGFNNFNGESSLLEAVNLEQITHLTLYKDVISHLMHVDNTR